MSKTVPGSTAGRQVTRFNTGHQFNIRVVEEASSDSFYRNLIEEIQGHFHSHLHDLQLEVLPKEEVILHLYDFLDFINDQKGSYERFSIAYAIYYKEISKQVTDAKERVWNTLYSFYVHLGESSEVRALKFGLEKSKSDDTVHFARQVRSNVAAVLALDLDGLIMDRIWIDTSDFSSLLGAIYDKKAVQKMALLETLKSRCEASQQGIGLSGGEFLAILLFDFVQSRDIVDRSIKRAANRSSKQGSRERKVGSSKDGVKMSLMKQVFGEDPRNQGTQSPGYNQGDQNNYSDDEDEFDTYKPRSSSKNKKKTTKQPSTPNKPIKEQSSKSSAEKSKQLREAMISSYNNKLTELQYLTQEKCKSEDHLVNSIALIRKNAKDYNELLSFSTEVLSAFMDNYYKLKMAQLKEGDGGSRLPIKDSNVEGYKAIGSCAPKVMKKELRNLPDPSALQDNEDCAFPLLSLPHNVDISDKPMFAGYDSKEDFEASKGKAARKMSPSRHK